MNKRALLSCSLTIFVAVAAITGCSRPQGGTAREGQEKLDQSNDTINYLKSNHGIDLLADNTETAQKVNSWNWDKYSLKDILIIEKLLKQQIADVNRLLEIGEQKALRLDGKGTLRLSAANAQYFLNSLQLYKAHPTN